MSSSPQSDSSYKQKLRNVFLTHPESVGESYLEHQRAALTFAFILAVTALAALIHAIVPALCETTARRRIAALHERLQARSQ